MSTTTVAANHESDNSVTAGQFVKQCRYGAAASGEEINHMHGKNMISGILAMVTNFGVRWF